MSIKTPVLPWIGKVIFKRLLMEMSNHIQLYPDNHSRIRYQTAIAIGGYVGPRAKELLQFTWADILQTGSKQIYEFKTEKNRKVSFAENLVRIVRFNFNLINPVYKQEFILPSPIDPSRPISTRSFNKGLKRIFERHGIFTTNPSSHTLRKTFALRAFHQRGGDEFALIFVSDLLNHISTSTTRAYIGLRDQQIQEAYLSLDD